MEERVLLLNPTGTREYTSTPPHQQLSYSLGCKSHDTDTGLKTRKRRRRKAHNECRGGLCKEVIARLTMARGSLATRDKPRQRFLYSSEQGSSGINRPHSVSSRCMLLISCWATSDFKFQTSRRGRAAVSTVLVPARKSCHRTPQTHHRVVAAVWLLQRSVECTDDPKVLRLVINLPSTQYHL